MGMVNYQKGLASFGVPIFGSLGIGNVYMVCKTTDTTVYADVQKRYGKVRHSDGSMMLHADDGTTGSGIISALAATVESRNDYVVLMPSDSDYDITTALALNKKAVHLICPAGLGLERGATSAARIHQLTTATSIFAISDAAIEISGLWWKQYADVTHMTIAATSYALNIHHNHVPHIWSASPTANIICSGDGGAWGQVCHHNYFISQGGDDLTCAALITIGASATGARCDYNDFFMGDGNIATIGIDNAATKGSVNYNNFMTAGTDGTWTHCIRIGSYGSAIGNRGCVGDGAIISGGSANVTNVDNMNAVDGGVIDDLD
jgi:hypothetical protein